MESYEVELNEMKSDLGIISKVKCSKEEQKEFRRMKKAGEPISSEKNGQIFVDSNDGTFFRNVSIDMTNDEINQLMAYRQMQYLKSISSGVTFFVVLTVISLVISLLFWISTAM